jgi:tetratricopeptide (TPR) repeat protein
MERAETQHQMGNLEEAERHLHFALRAPRYWVHTLLDTSDFPSYTLAQFYLGRVLEQSGKKAEAINAYGEFLSHFENSTAKLPQIAEARAALKRLMRGPPWALGAPPPRPFHR